MEWTEVRKKKAPARPKHIQETTYFVTNVPEQAKKGEIREAFGRFGRVTDVYMGDKKGKNGKYFVFVRFGEVKNVMELEEKINGMTYRGNKLEVNLARHKRKDLPNPNTTNTYHWLHKTSLIGEALTLDHLGHLPKLLRDNGETDLEIKYVGGLRVLFLFDSSVDAKDFLNNKNKWKETLKWVNWSDKTDMQVERVAWIRIIGLPLYLWGERNFASIIEGFGKTIAPYEDLSNRVDLSCPKIGILTSRKTRINEELQVVIDGRVFKIGIIEFDEDWFPFRFDKSEDYYETQDEGDEEDSEYGNEEEDGISDTYMGNPDDEKEEGEISPELQTGRNVVQSEGGKATNIEIGDEFPTRQPTVRSEVIETAAEVQRTPDEQMTVRDSMLTEYVASPRILEALMDNGNIPGLIHNSKDKCPGPGMESNPNLNGLSYELPPIGCFGPFKSPIVSNKGIRQSSEVCSSLGKRRRLEHDEPRRPYPFNKSDD
uniref:RRM domain-containing protein n=1 Tax=Lactuca sativa TaxID=4236 RepID=A0A9R1UZN6_LACSA|nr:hypothetical protein LSAT_V11C700343790 [Lactuca sativa]